MKKEFEQACDELNASIEALATKFAETFRAPARIAYQNRFLCFTKHNCKFGLFVQDGDQYTRLQDTPIKDRIAVAKLALLDTLWDQCAEASSASIDDIVVATEIVRGVGS